ncbi:hypothetical protein IE53DRAFT_229704 [Violaceomyces palustris]|uniref:Uncharacterized protein n=1 Tax=Violaceomyces palustris TaxID=1673888 RepID=A0ACD0NPQ6_9BASI|nr:hypothetical protein IE53DRAFT_229704 [Violaceomyces palustris]
MLLSPRLLHLLHQCTHATLTPAHMHIRIIVCFIDIIVFGLHERMLASPSTRTQTKLPFSSILSPSQFLPFCRSDNLPSTLLPLNLCHTHFFLLTLKHLGRSHRNLNLVTFSSLRRRRGCQPVAVDHHR